MAESALVRPCPIPPSRSLVPECRPRRGWTPGGGRQSLHPGLLLQRAGPLSASAPPQRATSSVPRPLRTLVPRSGADTSASAPSPGLKEAEGGPPGGEAATAAAQDGSDEDRRDVEEILRVVELLKQKRGMTFGEIRLTVMIEDPREVERRRQLGLEDDRGCSREDLANALVEVNDGRLPEDRVVLRQLAEDMRSWPNLEEEADRSEQRGGVSPYARVTDTGVDPKVAAKRAGVGAAAAVDWDAADDIEVQETRDISSFLPKWVGYTVIYGVSIIPIIIGVVVVIVLFLNSLQ